MAHSTTTLLEQGSRVVRATSVGEESYRTEWEYPQDIVRIGSHTSVSEYPYVGTWANSYASTCANSYVTTASPCASTWANSSLTTWANSYANISDYSYLSLTEELAGSSAPRTAITQYENRISTITASTDRAIWESELGQEYQMLGEALSDMVEAQVEDEWRIERDVYDCATYLAAKLMGRGFPAPQVFTHGPESVVFNWTHETNNLYLTVGADRISLLVSSPEMIKRRKEYLAREFLNQPLALLSLDDAHLQQAVAHSDNRPVLDPL